MLLIPGIAFTNSLRDMFSGDTITGLIRCMEALLLALVVGLGLRWRISCFSRIREIILKVAKSNKQ